MTALPLGHELFRLIEDHVVSDVEREVGGVLVGTLEGDKPTITAVIPALAAVGSAANVTFTQEVWEDVHQRIDREHTGAQIVGWYHSHPGFGIFLSAYDLFIHENFFSAPGQVALVVDPLAGEAGWFGWRDKQVVELERFPARSVTRTATAAQAAHQVRSNRWRNVAALSIPVAVLAGFIAGQLIVPEPATARLEPPVSITAAVNDVSAERLVELESQVARQQDQILALEEELTESQREEAAGGAGSNGLGALETLTIGYTITKGDTLWGIAERLYGDGSEWVRLADANAPIDPRALIIGSRLLVPIQVDAFIRPESADQSNTRDSG